MLDAANELVLREAITTQAGLVANVGFVNPSPLYLNDRSEFWATFDNSKNTRDEIELNSVAGLWIYPFQFVDDFTSGGIDSPLVNLSYEMYLFRQYGREREDEDQPPEVFESMVLKQHNLFISAWLGLKSSFQGNRNVAGLDPLIFATVKTTSLVQNEFIQNQSPCEFIPGAVGFAVRMLEAVQVKLKQC